MEESKLKDKKLYSYKQALSQPYWIQRFNDSFSLPSPVKLSQIVYGLLICGLTWFLTNTFMSWTPWGMRLMLSFGTAFLFSTTLSDLIIDGKPFFFYIKDYLYFYFKYGRHADDRYINKGQFYVKPNKQIISDKGGN